MNYIPRGEGNTPINDRRTDINGSTVKISGCLLDGTPNLRRKAPKAFQNPGPLQAIRDSKCWKLLICRFPKSPGTSNVSILIGYSTTNYKPSSFWGTPIVGTCRNPSYLLQADWLAERTKALDLNFALTFEGPLTAEHHIDDHSFRTNGTRQRSGK